MGQLVVVCMLCRIVGGPAPQCSLDWTFLMRRPRLRPEIDRHETCGHDGRQIIPGEAAQFDEIYRFRARNKHLAKFSQSQKRKGLTRAFPFLKVPTSPFTFLKNPLRQYAKQALKQGK